MEQTLLEKAADAVKQSRYTTAFTGAGISVESGIPPFRGEKGLWNKYDPRSLELDYFFTHPKASWEVIVEIFYDFFDDSKPNRAHEVLALLEQKGLLKSVITQNIDNLHQEAGNTDVIEFHGNSRQLVCTNCAARYSAGDISMDELPVLCPACEALVKPDFIFFGEGIPPLAFERSVSEAEKSQVMLVVGTTAEVMPAAQIPVLAKSTGATIIEINPEPSLLTRFTTDIFLQGKASEVLDGLLTLIER